MMTWTNMAGGGALLAAGAVVLLLAGRALWRVRGRPTASWRQLLGDTQGTATIEFALLFPIALLIILAMAQVTLLMGGLIFVHYSAQAAVRSAVVKIPADHSDWGEPPNVIAIDAGSGKYTAIRRAAVFSLVPVSGRLSTGSAPAQAYAEGLRQHYQAHGQTPPRWIDTLAGDRLRYADANTFVTVVRTESTSPSTVEFAPLAEGEYHWFGPREAVTVRVAHRMYLSVPYVRVLFADDWHADGSGVGAFTWIEAQSTLVNHGIQDALPPAPGLPRLEPG